jgi:hypothetical protein
MRAALAGITAAVLVAAAAFAAGKLTPSEIQSTFFTGQAFTAATPQGIRYKMVFTPDGKMTREPVGKAGAKSEGTWKLSKDGYCTTCLDASLSQFGRTPSSARIFSGGRATGNRSTPISAPRRPYTVNS